MSKMSELSLAVTELKRCGEALISISESLADLFGGNGGIEMTAQPNAKVSAPDEKPIALEAVRAVLAEKSRAGHTAEIRALLEKYGAEKLSEINEMGKHALLSASSSHRWLNCPQATSRDILCYAMENLRHCSIVMHVHDEIVIEADHRMSTEAVCKQMGQTPPWAKGLLLRADGYETDLYKKD